MPRIGNSGPHFKVLDVERNFTEHNQACLGDFQRCDDVRSKLASNPEHEHLRLAAGFDLRLNELGGPEILDDSGLLYMMLCDGLVLQHI